MIIAKVILGLGVVGILIGFLISAVSIALPLVTDGRTSFEEAMLGFIPGIVILIFSFFVALVGLIFLIMGRKK